MSGSRSKITLLVAEDDDLVRRSTASFLRKHGYEVLEAEDGDVALQKFREEQPEVLITDLRMPGLDGIDLLKICLLEAADMPVIILSGMGTTLDAIAALRLGVFDYITKPVQDMELILHAVQKASRHADLVRGEKQYQEKLEELVEQRTMVLLQQNRMLEREMKGRQVQEAMVMQAKKEWERTVDAIPDMIAIFDRSHHIVRMNKAMRDQLGQSYEQALQQSNCLFRMLNNGTKHERCPHEKTVADGGVHVAEMFDRARDSYLEVTTLPYVDPDGNLIGTVHIGRDITKRKIAEKEKEKLQSQLLHAQKLESCGQLAAGIAHEINTPAQFIGSNIDFLDEAVQDISEFMQKLERITEKASPEVADNIKNAMAGVDWEYLVEELPRAIEQSQDGVKRVTSIVQAMKEFSHPGGKEKQLQNLNKIIETTVTVARNEWKYVAEVKLDLDENLPHIPLLADEMGQVVLNMLVNAAHAIAGKLGENPEGRKGTINIKTEQGVNMVWLRISDTGTGIPEEVGKRIFDPFYTTKEVGKGTGQGLAISHDVITEKHGGDITFTTEIGKGTEFVISLPL